MIFLPGLFAVVGLFAGRNLARKRGLCPHRGKVWGAFVLPLLLLVVMMDKALFVLLVSAGAALGAGLTAHSSIRRSLVCTILGVSAATALGSYALL